MSIRSCAIAPEVFARFPDYRRGLVIAHGVANGPSSPELVALLRSMGASRRQIQVGLAVAQTGGDERVDGAIVADAAATRSIAAALSFAADLSHLGIGISHGTAMRIVTH